MNHRALSVALAAATASAGLLCSTKAMAEPWDKPGWSLTFHDEFEQGPLDDQQWQRRYKWGEAVINNELQAYVDDAFQFEGGALRIVGEHKTGSYAGQTLEYTSGVVTSVHEQRFGYFEIRCRMPGGKGLWPAFWLLGKNGSSGVNEIDIHEFLGHEKDKVYMTIHWGPSYEQGHESEGESFTGPDFTADFHTFAVEWESDHVTWFVDGAERFKHEGVGVPQVEMYVIANLAIGGGWPGSPDSNTPFPSYYDIDYIRAYERAAADSGVSDSAQPLPDAAGSDSTVQVDAAFGDVVQTIDGAAEDSGTADSAASADAASDSGAAPTGGAAGDEDDGGCGCRVGASAPVWGFGPAAAGILAAATLRYRRRYRGSAQGSPARK